MGVRVGVRGRVRGRVTREDGVAQLESDEVDLACTW